MKKIFQDYSDLETQIKELSEQKEAMRPKIVKELENVGVAQLKLEIGTFSLRQSVTYKYPASIQKLEKDAGKEIEPLKEKIKMYTNAVKDAKNEAEQTGVAKVETKTNTLAFRGK